MASYTPEELKSQMMALGKTLTDKFYKPVTKENIFFHYIPLKGIENYMWLSLSVVNPSLTSSLHSRY